MSTDTIQSTVASVIENITDQVVVALMTPQMVQPLVASQFITNTMSNTAVTIKNKTRRSLQDRFHSRHVVQCTPEIAFSERMQQYINTQTKLTRKQWVYEVIDGMREKDTVKLETEDYVMLPDIEHNTSAFVMNWLVVFKDKNLKTIRDLDTGYLQMLTECRNKCMSYILEHTVFSEDDILMYFHYLPSVYQLHLHICAPYGQCYTTLDLCKVHPIDNVISNITICGDYYRKITLTTVIIGNNELLSVFKSG
jgi:hypothetical protein